MWLIVTDLNMVHESAEGVVTTTADFACAHTSKLHNLLMVTFNDSHSSLVNVSKCVCQSTCNNVENMGRFGRDF